MARKKREASTPDNGAAVAVDKAPSEHPGWNPPRQPLTLATAPNATQSAPAAVSAPAPVVQPEVRYESVLDAERPTGRVTGYGSAVELYLERYRHIEDEKMTLEEGKAWFRKIARQFQQSQGAETVVFATEAKGSVDVVFTENRCALKPEMVAHATKDPAVAALLESTEVLDGQAWTWLLDNAQVPTPDGAFVTLRNAIGMGLNYTIKTVTKLRKGFGEQLKSLRAQNALSPEAELVVDQLKAAGLAEPTVRTGR